jgi:hypothetical protein
MNVCVGTLKKCHTGKMAEENARKFTKAGSAKEGKNVTEVTKFSFSKIF